MKKMNIVWLTPIKSYSWSIIFKNSIFGVSQKNAEKLNNIQIGNYLAFYLLSKKKGIIGLGKIISKPYYDDIKLWDLYNVGTNKYPYRIDLCFNEKMILKKEDIIPLYQVMGFYNKEKGYIVEPLLKNVIFLKLPEKDALILFNLMHLALLKY